MADPFHVEVLKQGAAAWNIWRRGNNDPADLCGANFDGENLSGVDLRAANLQGASFVQTRLDNADLSGARLNKSILIEAYLTEANLSEAFLSGADLVAANLDRANLTEAVLDAADLSWTSLRETNLVMTDLTLTRIRAAVIQRTDFSRATLEGTVFIDVDLSNAVGLSTCDHSGPSTIDHIALQRSGRLPLRFLRGLGLQEAIIAAIPNLPSVQYYSCFISYSDKDREFANQLYSQLSVGGVRCWFAPHNMPFGAKILDEIDNAIRLRDRVLLILSGSSIKSEWVEDEVTKAFEEERRRGSVVLFPIRLDDAVMESVEPWAAKLRTRHIADFRDWRTKKVFLGAVNKMKKDLLRAQEPGETTPRGLTP